MREFLKNLQEAFNANKKTVIALFCISLAVRLAMLLLLTNYGIENRVNVKLSPQSTAGEYIQMTLNIIRHQTFSISDHIPPSPNNSRTPLYSLFLVPFFYFQLPYWVITLFQNLIFSIFISLFYLIAAKIFHPSAVLSASIFFALEPYSILAPNLIESEVLFIPFLLSGFLSFLLFLKTTKTAYIYTGSAFLGMATLTRPTALYFMVFIPLLTALKSFPPKKIAVTAFVCAIIFTAILAPWIIRNRVILNTWQVSSLQDYNIFFTHANGLCTWLKEKCDDDFAQIREQLAAEHSYDFFHGHNPRRYRNIALDFLSRHPVSYALFLVQKFPNFFIFNNYGDIVQLFSEKNYFHHGLTSAFLKGDMAAINGFFSEISAPSLFIISGKIIYILLTILFLASFLLTRKGRENRSVITLTIVFILLYALISTPSAHAGRYRLPVLLPMAILAFETLGFLFGKIKRTGINHPSPEPNFNTIQKVL